MIIKQRKVPLKIQMTEALLRRLPKNHPKRDVIEKDLQKWKAGYRGEQSLDYYLSFLPSNKYLIIHDLRLKNGDYVFQIDTLIMATRFAIIIEVKNIAGTLIFDQTFKQFIRVYQDKEERFPDPLLQVSRQQLQLKKWLIWHGFSPNYPIEMLVVNTNNTAILKTNSDKNELLRKVIHVERLTEKITEMKELHKNGPSRLKSPHLQNISRLLINNHLPPEHNILDTYEISRNEIIPGVHCVNCDSIPMKRSYGTWSCIQCQTLSPNAHEQAITDYLLLIEPSITNQQCRNFLLLQNPKTVNKLLNQMNLKSVGITSDKVYLFSPIKS